MYLSYLASSILPTVLQWCYYFASGSKFNTRIPRGKQGFKIDI